MTPLILDTSVIVLLLIIGPDLSEGLGAANWSLSLLFLRVCHFRNKRVIAATHGRITIYQVSENHNGGAGLLSLRFFWLVKVWSIFCLQLICVNRRKKRLSRLDDRIVGNHNFLGLACLIASLFWLIKLIRHHFGLRPLPVSPSLVLSASFQLLQLHLHVESFVLLRA